MSPASRIAGDEVNVAVLVEVEPAHAFRVFTEESTNGGGKGLKYRVTSAGSVLHLEPRVGGRLFESFRK